MSTSLSLKVMYHTFGCKLNFAETASVAERFAERGHLAVDEGDTPDIIVVNSCSVTAEADRKCRSAIRSWHRRWPDAAIIVTGCYAQLKPEEVQALPGVKVVAGVNDKLRIPLLAEEAAAAVPFPPAKDLTEFMPSCSRGDRTRFFLKVQDGCDYWCTYCTIPRARGRSRSGTIAQIVEQARQAAAQGGREIVLTGVNTGDFGRGRGETLLDLCRELDKVDGIERYRISSIEPNLLTDELIDFCAQSEHFMPHFHVPLQSGSDRVLELMRRRYDTAFFASKMQRIRQAVPDAFIGVDLIVGARGETAEEFARSRDFVDSLDISHLHVFPYSERPDTRALSLPDAVDQAEKHRRADVMIALGNAKHEAFARRFLGTVRPVLLEHSGEGRPMSGFTDNYLRIRAELDPALDNTVVPMLLDALAPDGMSFLAKKA
ncbi:MAG: tRNA (N(6)-L-threonylcarbamoyladenosine(37)-C(2))-methylthiotransferase MtaB [Muribaculaceae bacterium]|nr:tRNA (N(6)-L-threonylcarbamoyladenosine(37)-C(2))-methylthiotransferase MtaB [Muribaculaceae bacterium]